jgi:hypothetical protein
MHQARFAESLTNVFLVTRVSPDRQRKVDKLHAVLGYSPMTG